MPLSDHQTERREFESRAPAPLPHCFDRLQSGVQFSYAGPHQKADISRPMVGTTGRELLPSIAFR